MRVARQPSAKRVVDTDYAHWPACVRRHAIAPLEERQVDVSELRDFLAPDVRRSHDWSGTTVDIPTFPKIGVCSWKEWPWLLPYRAGDGVNLFRHCSARMRVVLSAWIELGQPAMLRFYPFVEYSATNEYRFLTRSRVLQRSVIHDSHDGVDAARELLDHCAPSLGDCIIDIATCSEGGQVRPWVVELNPCLERRSP